MNVNDALACISPNIRGLSAYHLEPEEVAVKLNQNENPFDWPAEIKDEIAEFCRTRPWNRYPDFIPQDLKRALARYAGVSAEQIIAGNGSNEMLLVLLLTFGATARSVVICQPCFTVYSLLCRGMGLAEKTVFLESDLQFNAAAIRSTVQQNPGSLLILNSPNNPVGCALGEADLRSILDVHTGICVLDQAYVEFGAYNALPLLAEFPNLIITRTFSKAFGGAGLRLGYMIGAPEVIGQINKIKLPYNINFFSSQVAITLLDNLAIVDERLRLIVSERKRVVAALKTISAITTYPTTANFVLIRTPAAARLFAELKTRGILVRDVSRYPMLDNCLRLSIGAPHENDLLLEQIRRFFSTL
jgi:histidinol-phosphate aminotransferase